MEKANHCLAQRWWRTLPEDLTSTGAQSHLDAFCVRVGDARRRMREATPTTVDALAGAEVLHPPPAVPYPASLSVQRVVSAQALVAFRGNFYSIPPGLGGATVTVHHRLGQGVLEVRTARGVVLARHRREPDGAGVIARHDEHVLALDRAVLAQFSDRQPCRAKVRRPPSLAARNQAGRIRGQEPAAGQHPCRRDAATRQHREGSEPLLGGAVLSSPRVQRVDYSFWTAGRGHAEAVARIRWCITENALGVIIGEVGAGKTVALRAALAELDPSRHTVIYLPNPAVGARGLYAALVAGLGGVPRFHTAALIAQTMDHLAAEYHERGRAVICAAFRIRCKL